MIEIVDLSHSYGGNVVLKNLSLSIRPGEIFGILGPNGAGKSTLINILITLIERGSGNVRIAGIDIDADPMTIRSRLGVVFQDSTLDERLTVRENLYFHSKLYGIPTQEINTRVSDALNEIGLGGRAGELVINLSGGMKRRLEIARALIHRPSILILDEPTTGLDPQSRKVIWERMRQLNHESGTTIVLSTHYIEEAENCNRIAIIDQGEIIAIGSPDEIRVHGGSVSITGLKRPSLEDAFIALTGELIQEEHPSANNHIRGLVRERKLA
ncbi:MAG: ABC transporter ATP-binding protein [Rectinemataceae bacterium]|nr:ABC transporter ATP-binding protein [Rectinemataceae bacterium]